MVPAQHRSPPAGQVDRFLEQIAQVHRGRVRPHVVAHARGRPGGRHPAHVGADRQPREVRGHHQRRPDRADQARRHGDALRRRLRRPPHVPARVRVRLAEVRDLVRVPRPPLARLGLGLLAEEAHIDRRLRRVPQVRRPGAHPRVGDQRRGGAEEADRALHAADGHEPEVEVRAVQGQDPARVRRALSPRQV